MRLTSVLVAFCFAGCYNVYRVPAEELYKLSNLSPGAEIRLQSVDQEDVIASTKSEFLVESDDGHRATLQLNRANVQGNTLSGTLRNGAPVQVELPRIALAEVKNFSPVKTGLLAGGISLAVVGAIVATVVILLSASPTGASTNDFDTGF